MRDLPPPNPGFTGIFIPVEILNMDLSPNEMFLLAWIDALSRNEKNACYASNSYFAQRLGLKENSIQIMISKLKSIDLVEQIGFDGRIRLLRACKERWFQREKSESQADHEKNHGLGVSKITGHSIYSKEENKESKDIGAGSADATYISKPSSFEKKKKDIPKKERAPHIFISDEDHSKMINEHGEELVQAAYLYVSEWKVRSAPSKVKKHSDDYLRVSNWGITAIREKRIKEKNLKAQEERVKSGALPFQSNFVDKIANRKFAETYFIDGEKYGDYRAYINEFGIHFEGEGQDPKKPGVKFADPDFQAELKRKCEEHGIKPRKKK